MVVKILYSNIVFHKLFLKFWYFLNGGGTIYIFLYVHRVFIKSAIIAISVLTT